MGAGMVRVVEIESRYDGLKVSTVVVSPDSGRPGAVLQIAHGMCGSKERFMPFMEFMAGNGVACIANDHRGHGGSVKSDWDLGYMYDGGAEALVDDMELVAGYAMRMFPDSPLFLLGHSMGSLAARACIRHDDEKFHGLVLCGSPSYNPVSGPSVKLLSFLCRCGLGHRRPMAMQRAVSEWYNRGFRSEGANAWTCSDPVVRKSFRETSGNNFAFTVNGLNCLSRLMQEAYVSGNWALKSPDMPVLFLSGEDDPVMGGHAGLINAAEVMGKAGYRNVSVRTYPAMRHEILNEIGKEQVWRDILQMFKNCNIFAPRY